MFLRLTVAVAIFYVVLAKSEDTSSSVTRSSGSSPSPTPDSEAIKKKTKSTCVKRELLLDEIEVVIDEFVAFGITDEHATEFMDWIVNDVVESSTMKENDSETEMECFPSSRINEMGTRLGKMIAQDIAGERPAKRGRAIEDIELDDEANEEEEMEDVAVRKEVTPARKANPFRFDKNAKKNSKLLAQKKCCVCPKNHYAYATQKNNSKCKKGPCCPRLCRTLERLAGALSSARVPCCRKAHRQCIDNEQKFFMKATWQKKKRFRFDIKKARSSTSN